MSELCTNLMLIPPFLTEVGIRVLRLASESNAERDSNFPSLFGPAVGFFADTSYTAPNASSSCTPPLLTRLSLPEVGVESIPTSFTFSPVANFSRRTASASTHVLSSSQSSRLSPSHRHVSQPFSPRNVSTTPGTLYNAATVSSIPSMSSRISVRDLSSTSSKRLVTLTNRFDS